MTLVTFFRLREDAPPDRFVRLWTEIGDLMSGRSGFVSAGLYPAGGGSDSREYIQVAHWSHSGLLANAQSDPEIRRIRAEMVNLVVFVRRVLCDAPIEELLPRTDPPHHQVRPRP